MPCFVDSARDCAGILYGMASVGPRKGCGPPTWLLISLTTSSARLVLSFTSPQTKNDGIVMSSASPHTTMSFTPIESDLKIPRGPNWSAERSFTECLPDTKYFALQSY